MRRVRRRSLVLVTVLILSAVGSVAQRTGPGSLGVISGVVVDALTRLPVGAANVQLGPPPRQGTRPGNMLSDEHGRFVFAGVAPGEYFINVIKGGYQDGHYGHGVNGALGGSIVLRAGEWFDAVNIKIIPLAAVGGQILDERGQPVVGAYVRALGTVVVAGRTRLAAGQIAITNDLGQYQLTGLHGGRYIIEVPSVQHSLPLARRPDKPAANGSVPLLTYGVSSRALEDRLVAAVDSDTALVVGDYPQPPATSDARQKVFPITYYPGVTSIRDAVPIDLSSGDQLNDLNVSLRAVPTVLVAGRVANPIADATDVLLRLVPEGLEDLGQGSEAATTAMRSDGSFTFLRVPAGQYTLVAPGASFQYVARFGSLGDREVVLPSTPGLAGRRSEGGVVSGQPELSYAIRGDSDANAGYVRQKVAVADKDIFGLEVSLSPTGVVRGRIIQDTSQATAIPASVELMAADGDPVLGGHLCAVTGALHDTFRCGAIIPGSYVLRVPNVTLKSITIDGEDYSKRQITILPGEERDVMVLVTGSAARLTGVVRDAKGAAVPLAAAIAFPEDAQLWSDFGLVSTWIRPSTGSSSGSFEIKGIRAGDYFVVGVDDQHMSLWADPVFLRQAVASATPITLNWGDDKALELKLWVPR